MESGVVLEVYAGSTVTVYSRIVDSETATPITNASEASFTLQGPTGDTSVLVEAKTLSTGGVEQVVADPGLYRAKFLLPEALEGEYVVVTRTSNSLGDIGIGLARMEVIPPE